MKKITAEWLKAAQDDLRVMEKLLPISSQGQKR
jgi:hypothetical protein